jgi:hypothetical protein
MKKHLVYLEDILEEIMKYPSRDFSKTMINACAAKVLHEKEVNVWKHIWSTITGRN